MFKRELDRCVESLSILLRAYAHDLGPERPLLRQFVESDTQETPGALLIPLTPSQRETAPADGVGPESVWADLSLALIEEFLFAETGTGDDPFEYRGARAADYVCDGGDHNIVLNALARGAVTLHGGPESVRPPVGEEIVVTPGMPWVNDRGRSVWLQSVREMRAPTTVTLGGRAVAIGGTEFAEPLEIRASDQLGICPDAVDQAPITAVLLDDGAR